MIFRYRRNKISTIFPLVCLMFFCFCLLRAVTNEKLDENVVPKTSAKIVLEIRDLMNDTETVNVPIQAYIIYSVDAHQVCITSNEHLKNSLISRQKINIFLFFQSEYVAHRDNRLQYVSKFTGSAGTALILENIAALWTDSRYYIQAEKQLDNETWTLMKSGQPNVLSIEDFLAENLPANSRVCLKMHL